MSLPVIAVLDIGSNSIKSLVATRIPGLGNQLGAVHQQTIDTRIGSGLGEKETRLSDAAIEAGVATVQQLLAETVRFAPKAVAIVATAAVREAKNGEVFAEKIRAATGHPLRLLSGEEEARLIGRGLHCDPDVARARYFHVFDLGGGSLEYLAFAERELRQSASLPLGCVRLTEAFISDPTQPIGAPELTRIFEHVRTELAQHRVPYALPTGVGALVTGGTATTARAIFAARQGVDFGVSDRQLRLRQLHELLTQVARLPLAERSQIQGLPAARADVFPAALTTLIAVAEIGQFDPLYHSAYNLRWGVAHELLSSPPKA